MIFIIVIKFVEFFLRHESISIIKKKLPSPSVVI